MNVANGVTPETADTARALSRLSEIALGYVGGRALHSACELGVFEALADGPMTLEAVAGRAGLEPLPFDRMCEYLTDALRENGPRWMQAFGTPAEDTFASLSPADREDSRSRSASSIRICAGS